MDVWNYGELFGAIDVAMFVLIIGGFLGVTMKTGAINAGIAWVVSKLKGKEKWMFPILMTIFAIGGTSFNPFATSIASGFAGTNINEGLIGRLVLLVVGTILGIVFVMRYAERVRKDPSKSLIYDVKAENEKRFMSAGEAGLAEARPGHRPGGLRRLAEVRVALAALARGTQHLGAGGGSVRLSRIAERGGTWMGTA